LRDAHLARQAILSAARNRRARNGVLGCTVYHQ
jgi:hypothetical protein